jgi:hypothetical protein
MADLEYFDNPPGGWGFAAAPRQSNENQQQSGDRRTVTAHLWKWGVCRAP